MLRTAVVLFVALCSIPARSEEWTRSDLSLQATFTATLAADWLQTRQLVRDGYIETNPLLGPRPSRLRIDAYFAACAAGHALVAHALPPRFRSLWQGTWIVLEATQLGMNHRLGVRVRF